MQVLGNLGKEESWLNKSLGSAFSGKIHDRDPTFPGKGKLDETIQCSLQLHLNSSHDGEVVPGNDHSLCEKFLFNIVSYAFRWTLCVQMDIFLSSLTGCTESRTLVSW